MWGGVVSVWSRDSQHELKLQATAAAATEDGVGCHSVEEGYVGGTRGDVASSWHPTPMPQHP